jgi:hypothetical protein
MSDAVEGAVATFLHAFESRPAAPPVI